MGNVPRRRFKQQPQPSLPVVPVGEQVTYATVYEEDPNNMYYIPPFLRRTVGPKFIWRRER